MERCVTCKSELKDTSAACPVCGSSAGLATGTIATVAMELPAVATPASNGSATAKPAVSRTSVSRMLETHIPDEGRFPPGTLVNGRYRIVGLLGRGGMGEVYRATDLTLAQAVALKFLPETGVSERVLERFHAEVRIARQISHPNICRVYDIGEVDGQPFISMEYVDGEDLADLLQRIGRLPSDKALETARKICAGLAAAHDRGVIHRDLKPQNIMLNKRGEPVIMDFGLAAVADQLTGAEARNGTPAYMSPEQLRGDEVTAKSDIYALGLVLYEIFSGKRAYEAQTIGDLLKLQEGGQVTSLTSLASDVDPQVEKVIKRCLDPNPALRPGNPLAVAAALPGGDPLAAALAAGETPSPEMVAASGKTEGMDLRYSVPLLAFVVLMLVGLPIWSAAMSALNSAPVSYPPTVAGYQARQIAASFGYTQAPVDSHVSFTNASGMEEYFKSHDRKGTSWAELIAAEPFHRYSYRESQEVLYSDPAGSVDRMHPAPVIAGMLSMTLTDGGRLRWFEQVPAERPEPTAAAAPGADFDEAALFRAIGYDAAAFSEVAPERTPLIAYDFRKAWKGPAPGVPDVEVRIEAASLGGRITTVMVEFPWSEERRRADKPMKASALVGTLGLFALAALGFLFGLIFAIRNLRRNRADKNGALRLALAMGLAHMVSWLGRAHHVSHVAEWGLLVNALGDALFYGVLLFMLYLALEPAVRSRWPQALVTWNRLLAGHLGDAQLGAHVLIGAAIGLVVRLADVTEQWVQFKHSGIPDFVSLNWFEGPLAWIGGWGFLVQNALLSGFLIFWALFGFRALWKNDYGAAVSVGLLFSIIGNGGIWASTNPWLQWPTLLVIFTLLAFVLIRIGMVGTLALLLFINSMGRIQLGPGFRGWYTPYGLAALAVLLSVAIYAFWRSIGTRTIGDETNPIR